MSTPFLRSMLRLDEVHSTSTYARELALRGGLKLPMLVRADRQTAGRGRGDHVWWSDGGSLTFTLILDPAHHGLRTEHEPRLALVAALAIIDAVGRCRLGGEPGIRWPNDVEAADRKLAGLLPERVETSEGPRILLGIGINVASRLDEAPEAIRLMATTVEELRGEPCEGDSLLSEFLDAFALTLSGLAGDDPELWRRWQSLDTLSGRSVRLDLGAGRLVSGIGRGINPRGGLVLDVDGVSTAFYGGQVLREGG